MVLSRRALLRSGVAAASAVLASRGVGANPQPVRSSTRIAPYATLDAIVTRSVAQAKSPGIAVSLWQNDKPLYARNAA